MKKTILLNSALGMMAVTIVATSSQPAVASYSKVSRESYFTQKRNEVKPVRPFRGKKVWSVDALAQTSNLIPLEERNAAIQEPVTNFRDLVYYDYLEGPDGKTWFYTAEYEVESVEVSEWYSENDIKSFKFDIYNEKLEKIGTVSDKIELVGNETKTVSVVLDPAVSYTFFNDDANPEVMVYIAVNTDEFVNNYYNKIYSVGGEKDAEGYDKMLFNIPGRCVDAVNISNTPGEENFYFTFAGDYSVDLDGEYDSYVDFLNAYYQPITTYGKAVDEKGPQVVYNKNIFMSNIPGDTTDGIYFITKPWNGTVYIIYSYYEKPYFIDPTGMAQNEDPTPDNSLIIEVIALDGDKAKDVSTTKIPVVQIPSDDQLMYSFYSIGSVAWKDDVDMIVNGSPSAPAFIVARDVMNAATYEELISDYSIYGNDGKLIKEVANGTDGIVLYETEENKEPVALFVTMEEGTYWFNVYGLYSGTHLLSIDQYNNGDSLSASTNRVKDKDGNYKYVFVMTYYDEDEEGNEYIRVAWYNEDGTLDRIDPINMGKDVMAGSVNIFGECLNPYLYDDDDAMEYAVLVKRINGPATRDEFIVVDDNGKWYAHFSEDDGKGDPRIFTIVPGETNYLLMAYDGFDGYNLDMYALPFVGASEDDPNTAVDFIENDNIKVTLSGNVVSAPGCKIEVFTSTGLRVANGNNEVSLNNLTNGVYIIMANGPDGNKTVFKTNKR
ncbi:MAG: hypothetical protein J1F12_01955 [Muribaculaceae bacterium]|nr:hypothetical protein [Muribaculaceae bacterium]